MDWRLNYLNVRKVTKYLRFVIDRGGIQPNIDKVEVIRAITKPWTVRKVRGFIGVIGYYKRFIPAFWRLATLLIAFSEQKIVSDLLILWRSNWQLFFYWLTQTWTSRWSWTLSNQCIRVCLLEKDSFVLGIPEEIPIYFLSHRLSPT